MCANKEDRQEGCSLGGEVLVCTVQYSHEVRRASGGPHQCTVFESLGGLLLK